MSSGKANNISGDWYINDTLMTVTPTVLNNTSGTNTGDQTNISGNAATASAVGTITGGASSSDQTTGTSTIKAVTPAVQQSHASAAKVWALFHWSGSAIVVDASYNVSSITRSSAGIYVVNFTTAFSTANFATLVSGQRASTCEAGDFTTPATGSVSVRWFNSATNAAVDPTFMSVACFGAQ